MTSGRCIKIICDIDIVKVMADLGLHVKVNLETSNINDSGYVVDIISEIFCKQLCFLSKGDFYKSLHKVALVTCSVGSEKI
jgi:hypothetical protein